eukprot:3641809-Amphidinium_carterae.1
MWLQEAWQNVFEMTTQSESSHESQDVTSESSTSVSSGGGDLAPTMAPLVIDVDVLHETTCRFRPAFSLRDEASSPARSSSCPCMPLLQSCAQDDAESVLTESDVDSDDQTSSRQSLEAHRQRRMRQVLSLRKRRAAFRSQWPPPALARKEIMDSLRPSEWRTHSPHPELKIKVGEPSPWTPLQKQQGTKCEQTPENVALPWPASCLKRARGGVAKQEHPSNSRMLPAASQQIPTALMAGMPKKELLQLAERIEAVY